MRELNCRFLMKELEENMALLAVMERQREGETYGLVRFVFSEFPTPRLA